MKTIVYYISEYGYGHASRSLVVIRELLKRNDHLRIVICNQFALQFLKDSLREYENRVIFHEVSTDVGYALCEGTLMLDDVRVNALYHRYRDEFAKLVCQERGFLMDYSPDGIISDISPLAFAVGTALGVRSIGISNFTWAGACEDVLEQETYEWLVEQYEKANFFYRLAGFNERMDVPYKDVGFYSRSADEEEVARLKRQYAIKSDETVIFIAIGMKIELDELSSWKLWSEEKCRFIVSSNMNVNHPSVITIPSDYTESQNYVAMSDVVVTKAGWGTVGEAVSNSKRLVIINREMKEDQNTLVWLKEHYEVDVVEWDRLISDSYKIRNSYKPRDMENAGVEYHSIGREAGIPVLETEKVTV